MCTIGYKADISVRVITCFIAPLEDDFPSILPARVDNVKTFGMPVRPVQQNFPFIDQSASGYTLAAAIARYSVSGDIFAATFRGDNPFAARCIAV